MSVRRQTYGESGESGRVSTTPQKQGHNTEDYDGARA